MSDSKSDMMSGLQQAVQAQDVPESLAQQCRRHMDDPKLPPEITRLMHDTAKALEWQELVLTGLSTQEKDVIGALSQTIATQQRQIRNLEQVQHDHEMRDRMDMEKNINTKQVTDRMMRVYPPPKQYTVTGGIEDQSKFIEERLKGLLGDE